MSRIKAHKFDYPHKKRVCTEQWQVDRIAKRAIKEREARNYSYKVNTKKL